MSGAEIGVFGGSGFYSLLDDVTEIKPDPEILAKTIDRLGGQVERTLYAGDRTYA